MSATSTQGADPQAELPPGVEVHRPSSSEDGEVHWVAAPDLRCDELRAAATRLGFCATGYASVARLDEDANRLVGWLSRGFHGAMTYLERKHDRADPARLLAGAASMVVVALPHAPAWGSRSATDEPPVASFALGRDYHVVMKEKLSALAQTAADLWGRTVRARACVDTAPLLERAAARRAGVGFIGRSTMLIVPGFGSRVTLGVLLLDLPLPADPPLSLGCEGCDACVRACPTGALLEPFTLDARKCVSYLTIESSGAIPTPLRPLVGHRIFGCDACQDVCPHNSAAVDRQPAPGQAPPSGRGDWDPASLLALGSSAHRRLVRGTALHRVSRNRLARNAAIALGNGRDSAAVRALVRAVEEHPSGMVRAHAAWALGRIADTRCRTALKRAATADPDADVRSEAAQALEHVRRAPGG